MLLVKVVKVHIILHLLLYHLAREHQLDYLLVVEQVSKQIHPPMVSKEVLVV